jgi:thioredoxin 1
MRKMFRLTPLLALLLLWLAPPALAQPWAPPPQFPVKGTVTLVDLGADKCVPCVMMAPILKEVRQEYEGRAAVIFIDVWKNPAPGKRLGIRAIPTQIFYDKDGQEVGRHEGFLDKKAIVSIFEKLGVKK